MTAADRRSLLCVLCLLCCGVLSGSKVSLSGDRKFFSGVYTQPGEEYAGAFFTSKARFLASTQGIQRAKFPEAVIFNCIKLRNSCDRCENFLTRDYFDFSVEHLSSTTSILNVIPLSDKHKRDVFNLLKTRLERQVLFLKNSKKSAVSSSSTIAVVAFSDSEANADTSIQAISHQETLRQIRHNYFKATVYGILIHFSHLLVYVSSPKDKAKILNWSLPLLDVIDLSDTLARVPKSAYYKNRPLEQLLPKYAFLDLIKKMKATNSPQNQSMLTPSQQMWSSFSSIFYTEGDQILHMRKLKYLYQMFDASDGDFLFIPHRIQTLPLYDNFPPAIQQAWQYRKVGKPVQLVTRGLGGGTGAGGSCCDNGRLNLPGCGNWWYFCEKWGVANYTTWLRFGENGYTNALATEHQGTCTYSARHIKCPVPSPCTTRHLQIPKKTTGLAKEKLVQLFLTDIRACPENKYSANTYNSSVD